jgi:hypothetical protein
MPSKSKKQQNFMAAVANNPKFAKKAGVPQSVGKDYEKADKMKGMKKYQQGGMSMKDMAVNKMIREQGDNDRLDESMGERNGPAMQGMQARRDESEGMEEAMGRRKFAGNRSMDKAMPRMKKGGKVRGAGCATKGTRAAKMVTMKGA